MTGWFLGDPCVLPSENGTMEKGLILLLLDHVNLLVRNIAPDGKFVLCLDGHS